MRQFLAEVASNQPIMDGVNLMWLKAPDVAREGQPGQFLMVRCGEGYDPLLRRALSIHRMGLIPGTGNERGFALLYSIAGQGTAYLRSRRPGDALDIIAPLGHGFSVHRDSRQLLLLGSGWGVSPLVALAEQQVARGRSVTLLMGAARASQLYPSQLLPPEVELQVATDDGSAGHHGSVADLAGGYWGWCDEVFACGPAALYKALAESSAGQWPRKRVQVLAEQAMACGVGACYACAVTTRRGYRLACVDGPRFDLTQLVF